MKSLLGYSGTILVVLGYQLLPDSGGREVVLFLGACMCCSAISLALHPILDCMISESSRNYYLRRQDEYLRGHEEMMRRVQEELGKRGSSSSS